ncbi:MAG: hypothetical protein AAF497_22100, partial [Planctomycetota bacterium]
DDMQGQTQSNVILGTPAFMSPEQAEGAQSRIGPATDVYAIGATLYFLLTGQPPLLRDSEIATLQALRNDDPTPPTRLNTNVPRDLQSICLKCLEKEPRSRYESAFDLAEDVNRFLAGQPVKARPLSNIEQFNRWCRRNTTLAIASASVAVILVAATTISLFLLWRNAQSQKLAATQTNEAIVQTQWSRKAVDRLLRNVLEQTTAKGGGGQEQQRKQLLETAREYYQELSQRNTSDTTLRDEYAATILDLAKAASRLGKIKEAVEMRTTILKDATLSEDIQVTALHAQSEDLLILHNLKEGVELSESALALVRNMPSVNPDDFPLLLARNLTQLASAMINQGNLLQANALIDKAIQVAVQQNDNESPMEWQTREAWGRVLKVKCAVGSRLQDVEGVKQAFPAGVRIYETILKDHPRRESAALESLASLHKSLSAVLAAEQNYEDVEPLLDEEEKLVRQLIEKHPDIPAVKEKLASNMVRRAQASWAQGKHQKAREEVKKTLKLVASLLQESPQLKSILIDEQRDAMILFARTLPSSNSQFANEEINQVAKWLEEMIEMFEELCAAPSHAREFDVGLIDLKIALSNVSARMNQSEDALNLARQAWQSALQHLDTTLGTADRITTAGCLLRDRMLDSDQPQLAMSVVDEGLQRLDGLPPDDVRRVPLETSRIELLVRTGKVKDAVKIAEGLLESYRNRDV